MQARVESKLDKFLKYRYYSWFVGHKLYDFDRLLTFKLKVHFFTEYMRKQSNVILRSL